MHSASMLRLTALLSFTLVSLLTLGCGQSSNNAPPQEIDDHSGWWCAEHGVPEAECSQCSQKFAAECKKRGDWCKQHNVAESQCFICHPEKEAEFAARFEEKYGKKPPTRKR
jgi:hypothetical protein